MKRRTLAQLVALRAARRPVALVTDLSDGQQTLVEPDAQSGDCALDDAALALARDRLRHDQPGVIAVGERRWFVNPFTPPRRLLIVGAVHIAQALAPMAALAGFSVTVIDPRTAFAAAARFPGTDLRTDWPDEAMAALAPDAATAVVALTHDPKLDDPALTAALAADCFYVGALGSRKTHAARRERLAGLGPAALDRIHAPVGLRLGGRAPGEIALAILAQIVAVRYGAQPDLPG